ncbi:LURP-one-related/scramblase family protein [Demequina sp. NBRC 110057]|uniref:LURP-one-related/scramblase family protein n=1 Tax=Demequina sp. NBRC 110057 TaxID=1570346 RepID=UPI000A0439BA|nr:LURP-one-related family protein [Demequina sp. NBRC 110057]
MTVPAAPEGFARYVMKSKFGAGRDFQVLDPATEEQLFLVDGKMGPRPRCEVLDAGGTVVASVRGRMLGIPKRMDVVDGAGEPVARLHSPALNFVKDKVEVTLASGEQWLLIGNIIEKDYAVHDAQGELRIQITQKWLAVRDRYTIDVAAGTPAPLAFALVWAVDRWVERD